jgi:hypothetical protein
LPKDWIVLNFTLMLLGEIRQLEFQLLDRIESGLEGNSLHFVGFLLRISVSTKQRHGVVSGAKQRPCTRRSKILYVLGSA